MILNGLNLYNYIILSPNFKSNYKRNDSSPKINLEIISSIKSTDYVIINFIKPVNLINIDLTWLGIFDNLKIEISDNFITWETIFDGILYQKEDINKNIIFLKITFENHNANFKIIELSPNIEEILDTDRFISFRTHNLIPEKLNTDDYLLNPFIKTCLHMWEKGNTEIKFLIQNPFLIINESENYYLGGINTYEIDETPVDEDWTRIE